MNEHWRQTAICTMTERKLLDKGKWSGVGWGGSTNLAELELEVLGGKKRRPRIVGGYWLQRGPLQPSYSS